MNNPANKENIDSSQSVQSPESTTRAVASQEFRSTNPSTAFSDAWIEQEAASMTADVIKKIQNCGQFAKIVNKLVK